MEVKTVTIYIEGKPYAVDPGEGKNLLEVCLSLGFDLPYFCWHPAMHSVGACRQCAVKLFRDENDSKGRIIMSCMTAVADGMRVSVDDPEAKSFRAGIVELLMVNHPHDCPVCDEGGECHLQDMTVMTGHAYRRYRFTKRTHVNQDLGPFLNHEMNRCIQCYRCVRFYRDYAGGRDFAVQGWHDGVYFGRHSDGPLENEFSGNLCEVCPTGVFTDRTYKAHYTRKWDLRTAPSICAHCSLGCNTSPAEAHGIIRRVQPRYNSAVNGYFLCDRGRYGYEFANADSRPRSTFLRGAAGLAAADEADARDAAAAALRGGRVIGLGSPRASLETNFALRRLVGQHNFFVSTPQAQLDLQRLMAETLATGPARAATIKEVSESDAALVLGEDVWSSAPILGLALRQSSRRAPEAAAMKSKRIAPWDDAALREAVQNEVGPLFVASPMPTRLDDMAREQYRAAPDDIARLGYAVAHEIDPAAPAVPGLPEPARLLAARIAQDLLAARQAVVVSGSSLGSEATIRAAANVLTALHRAGKAPLAFFVFPEVNSLGVTLFGARGLESAEAALRDGAPATLVVAEADLGRNLGPEHGSRLLSLASRRIVLDHVRSATTEAADVLLPSAPFSESSGTAVSSEGRAQRFFAVFKPAPPIREAWRWLAELSVASGRAERAWNGLDELIADIEAELPVLAGIADAAPDAAFRINGQRIARGSHRESGRTARTANISVREPAPPEDPDSPLSHSMEGSALDAPAALIPRFWSPGWNSDQSINKFQNEIEGTLHGGDSGRRLLEPSGIASGGAPAYDGTPPAAFNPPHGELGLLGRTETFGSEELSARSPSVAARASGPYLALSRAEAERRGLAEGAIVRVRLSPGAALNAAGGGRDGLDLNLPLRIEELAEGIAVLPRGMTDIPDIPYPSWIRVESAAEGGGAKGAGR